MPWVNSSRRHSLSSPPTSVRASSGVGPPTAASLRSYRLVPTRGLRWHWRQRASVIHSPPCSGLAANRAAQPAGRRGGWGGPRKFGLCDGHAALLPRRPSTKPGGGGRPGGRRKSRRHCPFRNRLESKLVMRRPKNGGCSPRNQIIVVSSGLLESTRNQSTRRKDLIR